MSNVADLLDPLRYESLSEYTVANLEKIGAGVFTELQTLDHLALLDLITKAYQAVHLPTNGAICIPQSTESGTATQATTEQSKKLLTAGKNEVLEVLSIYAETTADYSITTGYLAVNDKPMAFLGDLDSRTQSNGGIVWGNCIDESSTIKQIVTPAPIYLNGQDTLTIFTKSAPNNELDWGILYRKVVQ